MKIAIVVSSFTPEVTEKLRDGALKALQEEKIIDHDIDVFNVPGSFELAPAIQRLVDTEKYAGFIAIGCVIKGETEHFTSVCEGTTYGLQKVSIENGVPVMNAVLMCTNKEQAEDRAHNNRVNKGYEAARGLVQMINFYKSL